VVSNFLERSWCAPVKTEPHADNLFLAGGELGQGRSDIPVEVSGGLLPVYPIEGFIFEARVNCRAPGLFDDCAKIQGFIIWRGYWGQGTASWSSATMCETMVL